MKDKKIFIACDTTSIKKVKKIIKETKSNKIKVGYKFGLEFFNSKKGRSFISKINNKIIFADLKLFDIPNTCVSAIKAVKDLKINYLTIHVSTGLKALKQAKKVCGKTKLIGVTYINQRKYYGKNVLDFDNERSKIFERKYEEIDFLVLNDYITIEEGNKRIDELLKEENRSGFVVTLNGHYKMCEVD